MKRLEVGQRVRYQGRVWRVILVNDCRAVLEPEATRAVQITRPNGDRVEFEGSGRTVNVSPNSELERV